MLLIRSFIATFAAGSSWQHRPSHSLSHARQLPENRVCSRKRSKSLLRNHGTRKPLILLHGRLGATECSTMSCRRSRRTGR